MLDVEESNPNPAIDAAATLERFDSDITLLREVAQLFLDDYPHRLVDVQRAIVGRDCKKLAETTHSLRGSLGNFGARVAIDAATRLERLAREGNLTDAPTAAEALAHEVRRVDEALKALF